VRDVLSPELLARMQAATREAAARMTAAHPSGLRYSFNSHSNLHKKEWCDLIELPTTAPILESIFQSKNYWVWGAGGDFSLPGTFEYQRLHRDIGKSDFPDTGGKLTIWDLPPFSVTLNFPMVDFTSDVGPIRQIPGTHTTRESPPAVEDEPEWMKLSTVLGLEAGGVVIRDLRAWHGGTPNLSDR
jgi:ectoine hydroxylase-related dioxygenase (phytanoyl-CoA dioxygenase family)